MDNKDKFAIFIACYKNTDVTTYKTLKQYNYNHDNIYLVIGSDDPNKEQFIEKYGDIVKVFDKDKVEFDHMIDSKNRVYKVISYFRNYCYELAEQLGYEYFIELDDDYDEFCIRYLEGDKLRHLSFGNKVFKDKDMIYKGIMSLIDIIDLDDRIVAMAWAQGGDFIGGASSYFMIHGKRKVMNSIIIKTKSKERARSFAGVINEDVNFYVGNGMIGNICLTVGNLMINQATTQHKDNNVGMTEVYGKYGTYYKSYPSVMLCPSGVKIGILNSNTNIMYTRIHHSIDWNKVCPKIISDKYKLK